MARHHCQHLQADIDQFIKSTSEKVVDKQDLKQEMVDKWSIKPSLAEKMVDIIEFGPIKIHTFMVPQWRQTPFSCSAAPHWPQRKGVREK